MTVCFLGQKKVPDSVNSKWKECTLEKQILPLILSRVAPHGQGKNKD